jgi:hypothetical protein
MSKFNLKEFGAYAVAPAIAINASGFVEPKLDNFLNGTKTPFSSNAANNTNAKYAKYIKATTYTVLGLATQAVTQHFLDEKDGAWLGNTVGMFFYGVSAATIAEDPVFNVPSPKYSIAGNPQSAPPAQQVTTRSANFIS